jgi:hypothetical protein
VAGWEEGSHLSPPIYNVPPSSVSFFIFFSQFIKKIPKKARIKRIDLVIARNSCNLIILKMTM